MDINEFLNSVDNPVELPPRPHWDWAEWDASHWERETFPHYQNGIRVGVTTRPIPTKEYLEWENRKVEAFARYQREMAEWEKSVARFNK